MFLFRSKLFFSGAFAFLCMIQLVYAQDSTLVVSDTIPKPLKNKNLWKINGLRFGLDLVPPVIFAFDSDFRNLEVSGELMLGNRFFLAADLGIDRTTRVGADHRYQSSGSYLRVGMDYNLWYKNKSGVGAIFSMGLHAGLASFKHSLAYTVNGSYWETAEGNLSVGGLTAGWIEIKSGLKAKIAPNLYMGPIARLRIRVGSGENEILRIHDIPGFGLNINAKIRMGYQLLYQIPFTGAK